MIKDSKVCLEKEKLWCLLSFVVWNKFLLLRNYEENEGIKVVNLSVGKNQVGLQNWKLYKKANILKRLDKVDLSASLVWRDLFHESLLEKMGKRVIRKFGYGYSSSNINNLSSSESKENEKNQNNNFGNKLVLSAGAKEFLANNPDWLDMDPKDLKFDNKPISRTLENSDYDELIPNDDLEDSESKDNSTNKIIKKI